jgi:hypothetical protein
MVSASPLTAVDLIRSHAELRVVCNRCGFERVVQGGRLGLSGHAKLPIAQLRFVCSHCPPEHRAGASAIAAWPTPAGRLIYHFATGLLRLD